MTDLFKIYKAFIQRERRNPEIIEYSLIRESMREIIKDPSKKSKMLNLAEEIFLLEHKFEINIPYQVMHRWNEEKTKQKNWLYLATSTFKRGKCKIGVTSQDPKIRSKSYISKYG